MMHDLEQVDKKNTEKTLMADMKASMGKPILPYLSFSAKEFPEIKDWKVGEEYTLELVVRMTGYSEHKSLDQKQSDARGTFEVTQVGVDADTSEK